MRAIFGVEIIEFAGHIDSNARKRPITENRNGVLRSRHKLFGHDRATEACGPVKGLPQLGSGVSPTHTQRRALEGWLDEDASQLINDGLPIAINCQHFEGRRFKHRTLPK